MKKGFTLIELLVVVLIIGILSAIALPQYTKAVEKARLAEGLVNISAIKRGVDIYIMQEGALPSTYTELKDILSAAGTELSGGTWNSNNDYQTKYFLFDGGCFSTGCEIVINRKNGDAGLYTLGIYHTQTEWTPDDCYTNQTDLGRAMCKSLGSQGWGYVDDGY